MGRDVVDAQEERLVSPGSLSQHFQANIGHLPGLALFIGVGTGAGNREIIPGKFNRRFCAGNNSPGPASQPVTVEAEFLRPQVLVYMPLARRVQRISRFLQSVTESGGIGGKSPAPGGCDVGIDHHPVIVRVEPRHQRSPRGRTYRADGVGLVEPRTFGREPVQVGCLADLVSVAAQRIASQLVGHEQDYVWCHIRVPETGRGRRDLRAAYLKSSGP